MSLHQDIYVHMLVRDYEWVISGEKKVPTADDIEVVLDKMRDRLYDEPENTMMEVGGIVMIKRQGHHDVYVRFGDLDENS